MGRMEKKKMRRKMDGWTVGQNEIQRKGETRQTDRETNDGLDPIPGRIEVSGRAREESHYPRAAAKKMMESPDYIAEAEQASEG